MNAPEASLGSLSLVVVHLTGPHRGTRQYLSGSVVQIGTGSGSHVHFPVSEAPGVAELHGTITAGEHGPELEAAPGQTVFVNGTAVSRGPLLPGDVIEVGSGGPILRVRPETQPLGRYKTLFQAMEDCVDCARHGSQTLVGRARILATGVPQEIFRQTRPVVRGLIIGVFLFSAVTILSLVLYARRLELRIDVETQRLATIEAAVQAAREGLEDADLSDELAQLQAGLSERIEALEDRGGAAQRVVSEAGRSVVFLQGSYTLRDPDGDRPLRMVLDNSGRPAIGPSGAPLVSVGGSGPEYENRFTGSAFVVRAALLVTNRHVALPWEFDPATRDLLNQGFRPELQMLGYLPGIEGAFAVELVRASTTSDLALLRSENMPQDAPVITLGDSSPALGTEVIVLGYPTGITALIARTSATMADSLIRTSGTDFWGMARRLSEADLIRPLATRGIVGQVTDASVVYDAETTRGGSGGPVLSLDGSLVAVTVGVMVNFDGSNLGVPVAEVHRLLAEADSP